MPPGASQQISTYSQSVNAVLYEGPFSPGQRGALQSQPSQSSAAHVDAAMNNAIQQHPVTPARIQGQIVAVPQGQQTTPVRPTFTKSVQNGSTPNGVVQSVPPNMQGQFSNGVPNQGQHMQQRSSGVHGDANGHGQQGPQVPPVQPAHVPDHLMPPTPQVVPNPYRPGSFEANGRQRCFCWLCHFDVSKSCSLYEKRSHKVSGKSS